jgi:hypothetical protein
VAIELLDAESADGAGRQRDHVHRLGERAEIEKRRTEEDDVGSGRRPERIAEQCERIELAIEFADAKRGRTHRLAARAPAGVEHDRSGRHDRWARNRALRGDGHARRLTL